MEESKQILIAIAGLEANMKNMSEKMSEIGKMSTLVLQTEQSAKSAHLRIDDVKKDIEKDLKKQEEDFCSKIQAEEKAREKLEGHITWLWRTIGTSIIGLIFGVILYAINMN